TAASYFEDITLTIGITPSDFIWQGFMQGRRDGCKEWPIEGESLFSYKGRPLPYMPFVYRHPDYWRLIAAESKRTGDMINSWKLFDDSEKAHPHTEDEMIKVENIKGHLLLVGASDDVLWDTVKYISRMEERLKSRPHECKVEIAVYEHGTHFIFPESMLRTMLPVFSGTFVKMAFQAAKKYPEECKETRMDIDRKVRKVITEWSLQI
ncbi:MAG: acyl-CoA thioester hydrolase, partial [Clostridium sp.]|nr:acyl-CoA thioester hydrolase [Clostridium sp.]